MTYNPELDWMFDGNGQIDSSLLPSYVDDVLDGYIHEEGGVTSFYKTRTGSGTPEDPFVYSDPYVPSKGIIYNEISNEDKPISFRWTGAHFVQIGASDFIVTDPNFPASAANEGKVILYMGNSVGGGFQHGHFYECKLVDGVYVWEPLPHVDSIPLEAIDQLFTN